MVIDERVSCGGRVGAFWDERLAFHWPLSGQPCGRVPVPDEPSRSPWGGGQAKRWEHRGRRRPGLAMRRPATGAAGGKRGGLGS